MASDKGKELLEKVRGAFDWNHKKPNKRYIGRGLALCVREVGPGESNVEVGIKNDGRVYILTTIPDTGTGSHTIFRQIVGEALGTATKNIDVVMGTTDSFVTDHMIGGSRVTYLAGQAALRRGYALESAVERHRRGAFLLPRRIDTNIPRDHFGRSRQSFLCHNWLRRRPHGYDFTGEWKLCGERAGRGCFVFRSGG